MPRRFETVAREDLHHSFRPVALIVVAVDVERDAVLKLMEPPPEAKRIVKCFDLDAVYYLGRYGAYQVALVQCHPGSTGPDGSILATSTAIERWHPEVVLMPGIAFGHDPKKHVVGDVLVSRRVIDYESQRVGRDATIDRGDRPRAGLSLINRLKNLGWTWKPKGSDSPRTLVHGDLLSGSKLVDNLDFKAKLFAEHPEAIGGEMEGFGVASASDRAKKEWVLVKAICDWGDGNKDKLHQRLAASNAAKVVKRLLSEPGLADAARTDGDSAPTPLAVSIQVDTLIQRVREAERRTEDKLASFQQLVMLLKAQSGVAPADQKPALEAARVAYLQTMEMMLNEVNDACAAYLAKSVDAQQFRDALGAEVLELVNLPGSHSSRLHPRQQSAYTAIWHVVDILAADPVFRDLIRDLQSRPTPSEVKVATRVLEHIGNAGCLPTQRDLRLSAEEQSLIGGLLSRNQGALLRIGGTGRYYPTLLLLYHLARAGSPTAKDALGLCDTFAQYLRVAWSMRYDRSNDLRWTVEEFGTQFGISDAQVAGCVALLGTTLGYVNPLGQHDPNTGFWREFTIAQRVRDAAPSEAWRE